MKLTKEEVEHIATLSRLALTDEEIMRAQDQLGSVLGYIAKLQEVDTKGAGEFAHASDLTNVFRADESAPSSDATREAIIEAFPRREGPLLAVQAVFEDRTE